MSDDNTTEELPATSGLPQITPRQLFSRREEETILKYIVKHRLYDQLRMMSMWNELAKYLNNGRTAEALRERFRRYIIPKIFIYNIPNDEMTRIITGYAKIVERRRGVKKIVHQLYLEIADTDCFTADNASEKLQLPATSELPQIIPSQSFSEREDQLMLLFIVKHSLYEKLKMMRTWEDMTTYFNNGRTPEALKERFRHFVIPRIYTYNIPGDIKTRITYGYANSGSNDIEQQLGLEMSDTDEDEDE